MLGRRRCPRASQAGRASRGVLSHVIRRFLPLSVVLSLLLAACGGGGATPTPSLSAKEIITRGLTATSTLKSFHLETSLEGNLKVPQMGGTVALKGTSFRGDFDLAKKLVSLSFAMPSLLGIQGQVIATSDAAYVKTSLTGEKWQKQAIPSGQAASGVQDPSKGIAEIQKFLDKDGVQSKNLADAVCGTSTCRQVELTIPSALLDHAAGRTGASPATVGSGSVSSVLGPALVIDMLFDASKLYLTSVTTSIDSKEIGSFTLTLTLSKFDQPVTITPPPADQVETGGSGLTLP